MKRLIVGLFFIGISFNSQAEQGNGAGAGGDPLRKLFEKARPFIAEQLKNLKWCSFPKGTSKELSEFILARRNGIIEDVLKTDYLWTVDAQVTCGYTQIELQAPIFLSYPTCASTVGADLEKALFTLLHETGHHFGFKNEKEADAFATAILDAKVDGECPEVNDIYSEEACQGSNFNSEDAKKYLAPGQTYAEVEGDFAIQARYKECTRLSGCGEWKEAVLRDGKFEVSPPIFSLKSKNDDAGFLWDLIVYGNDRAVNLTGRYTDQPHLNYSSGLGNRLQFYDTHLKYLGFSGGASFRGTLRQTCVWMKSQVSSHPDDYGFYRQGEIVLFGEF